MRLLHPRALRIEGLALSDSSKLQGMMVNGLESIPTGEVFVTDFGLRIVKKSQTETDAELEIGSDSAHMKVSLA